MNVHDIIRAWRDREFHEGLSSEELAKLPENPAGEIELFDEELNMIDGGTQSNNGCGSYGPSAWNICQF
jgi:mersacidin/lichenicidin family type 2 lantibiotic